MNFLDTYYTVYCETLADGEGFLSTPIMHIDALSVRPTMYEAVVKTKATINNLQYLGAKEIRGNTVTYGAPTPLAPYIHEHRFYIGVVEDIMRDLSCMVLCVESSTAPDFQSEQALPRRGVWHISDVYEMEDFIAIQKHLVGIVQMVYISEFPNIHVDIQFDMIEAHKSQIKIYPHGLQYQNQYLNLVLRYLNIRNIE